MLITFCVNTDDSAFRNKILKNKKQIFNYAIKKIN